MPALAAVSVAAAVGYALFNHVAPRENEPGGLQAILIFGLAWAILTTPICIAIFRFIILNEVTPTYRLDANDARYRAYCKWFVATFLVTQLPVSLATAYLDAEQSRIAFLIWLVVSAAVIVWSALIFPAIAADAPGATLRNALADLRGSFWRVLAVLWLIYLPFTVVILVLYYALTSEASDTSVVADTISSVATVCIEVVWVAASARLFLALADRLRSPAAR